MIFGNSKHSLQTTHSRAPNEPNVEQSPADAPRPNELGTAPERTRRLARTNSAPRPNELDARYERTGRSLCRTNRMLNNRRTALRQNELGAAPKRTRWPASNEPNGPRSSWGGHRSRSHNVGHTNQFRRWAVPTLRGPGPAPNEPKWRRERTRRRAQTNSMARAERTEC